MVYECCQPRRSADERLVDRFTRRETAAQRARRLARKRIDVPEAVINEFERSLAADTVRETRAIAQELTHSPDQETRKMAHTKRHPITKKAEPTPTPTPKPEPKAKAAAKPKAKAKKTAKPSDRATILKRYMADKLKIQKRVKLGTVITYHGRNETLDGKPVKVTGYETRGGVFVEFKGERYVISPHALLRPTK